MDECRRYENAKMVSEATREDRKRNTFVRVSIEVVLLAWKSGYANGWGRNEGKRKTKNEVVRYGW